MYWIYALIAFSVFFNPTAFGAPDPGDDFSPGDFEKYPPANPLAPEKALMLSELGPLSGGGFWLEFFVRGARGANLEEYALVSSFDGKTMRHPLPETNLPPGSIFIIALPASPERPCQMDTKWPQDYPSMKGTISLEMGYREIDRVDLSFTEAVKVGPPGKCWARDWASWSNPEPPPWHLANPSPGLPNDTLGPVDADGDGIPDANEAPGTTFAGLPLHAWGARPGVRDLFFQIDTMDSESFGVQPLESSLALIKMAFSNRGVALHFDVGNLFHGENIARPQRDDLRGQPGLRPEATLTAMDGGRRFVALESFRKIWLAAPRQLCFYYALFVQGVTSDSGSFEGIAGMGRVGGPSSLVGLGNSTRSWGNQAVNWQALVFMHEIGHNLGLRHGGFEDRNYKPNYLSIMNYLYSGMGLPAVGTPHEGDAYLIYNRPGIYRDKSVSIIDGPNLDPLSFFPQLDFSDGLCADLDENQFSEAKGLGRSNSTWVDFNGDGLINDLLKMDLNPRSTPSKAGEKLKDWNDWAHLRFYFSQQLKLRSQSALEKRCPVLILPASGPPTWFPEFPNKK